jgi:molybdopterin-synthase adenylyltransferase
VKHPRVKPIHHPVRTTDGRIRIGTLQYGVASEIQDDAEGSLWRLLGLMDGTRSVEGIVAASGGVDPDSVRETVATLVAAGFVEDAGAAPPAELAPAEIERYASNTRYFAWVDTEARPSPLEIQRRLKNAHVTVLGLGGTGGAVAMGLVAAGIGALRCVDFDHVELSNLSRQLLYGERDVGRPKVQSAVLRLSEINGHVDVTGTELRATSPDDVVALMEQTDLLVLSADQPTPELQLWTSEAALRTKTPWLISSYAGPMVVTGLFVPYVTGCYECFLAKLRDGNRRRYGGGAEALLTDDAGNAVIAPTANVTGHLGALEVIYFLTGLKPQTVGRVLHQNLMRYDHLYYFEPTARPECPACGLERTPAERRPIPTGGLE